MSEIQQAIFTSARSDQMDGYQLIAASEGIPSPQRDELSGWAPAHDSLLNPTSRLGSINFHRLSSGEFCLSKTVPAGAEYSGRSGPRVYTTFLLLTPEQFRRFAHQPFRVLDAAIAGGNLRVARSLSETLPCVKLRGRASAALSSVLEPLCDPQLRRPVLALAAALAKGNVIVHAESRLRQTLDRLFNLLPLHSRADVSFATGLKPSPQRPLKLLAAAGEGMQLKTVAKQQNAAVVDLDDAVSEAPSGWWSVVDDLLERGQVGELVSLLSQTHDELSLHDLPNWNIAVTP